MAIEKYLQLINFRIVSMVVFVAVGSAMASTSSFPLGVLPWLILSGGLASAGAKSLNSYFDKDLDFHMLRTRGRPLPLARINPPEKAAFFGISLCGVALLISYLTLGHWTAFFIFMGAFTYVVVYTIWLKRRSAWNIVIGGGAGSFSALGGWVASSHSIDLLGVMIAVFVFLWTPSHFWSLAIRIKDDYSRAGIPMLPSVVGDVKAARYILLNSVALVASSLAMAFLGFGFIYLVSALVAGALLLWSNIALLDPTPARAWRAFKLSNLYLIVVFVGMMVDSLL